MTTYPPILPRLTTRKAEIWSYREIMIMKMIRVPMTMPLELTISFREGHTTRYISAFTSLM